MRLLAGALALLKRTPALLQDDAEGGAFAGEIDAFVADNEDFVVQLVQTKWAPGEAPPGVEEVQGELKELEAERRKQARNKRKAAASKPAPRRPASRKPN